MNARCALVCSVSGICVFCMRVIVQMVASPLNLARGRAENNWRATKCWFNQHQQRSSSFQSNRMPRRFLHCIYIVFATKIRFFFCWNSLSCSLYLVWNLERKQICATSRISSIFFCKVFRWYGLLMWCTLQHTMYSIDHFASWCVVQMYTTVFTVQHWPPYVASLGDRWWADPSGTDVCWSLRIWLAIMIMHHLDQLIRWESGAD